MGSFLSIRPAANAQEASPFPLIGGVSLGRVEYLTFETKPDRKLENAFRTVLRHDFSGGFDFGWYSPPTYSYIKEDLNGDGRADAFVYLNNSLGSGSGGSHVWVFQSTNNGYHFVGRFLHTGALVVTPKKTSGWNNILVVPGKIDFDPSSFYSLCRFDPKIQIEIVRFDLFKYRNCQKIPRGSVISGRIIIDKGRYSGNIPSHRL